MVLDCYVCFSGFVIMNIFCDSWCANLLSYINSTEWFVQRFGNKKKNASLLVTG